MSGVTVAAIVLLLLALVLALLVLDRGGDPVSCSTEIPFGAKACVVS